MRNIKTKKKLKMLAMVMTLSIPMATIAQGGLFQRGPTRESDQVVTLTNQHFGHYVDGDNVTNQPFGHYVEGDNITNQTFGVPLGSGLLILLTASVGYAITKIKNNKSKNTV